jgi:hypothetical protein
MKNHATTKPAASAGQQQNGVGTGRAASPPMVLLRKPNRLSVLKNQPREFQQEIIDYLKGTGNAPRHGLKETVEWLRTQGVETGISSLWDFCQWWEEALRRGALATQYLERVARRMPEMGLSAEQILKVGQAFFEECAVNDREAKLFTAMMRLRQEERALDLQQVKLQMRREVARARAEVRERNVTCRERMTDLAIWKASRAGRKTEKPKTEVPNGDLPDGVTAMPEVAFAKGNTFDAKGEVAMAA